MNEIVVWMVKFNFFFEYAVCHYLLLLSIENCFLKKESLAFGWCISEKKKTNKHCCFCLWFCCCLFVCCCCCWRMLIWFVQEYSFLLLLLLIVFFSIKIQHRFRSCNVCDFQKFFFTIKLFLLVFLGKTNRTIMAKLLFFCLFGNLKSTIKEYKNYSNIYSPFFSEKIKNGLFMFTTTTFGKQKWMMKINKNKNKKMNLQEIFFLTFIVIFTGNFFSTIYPFP